MQTNPSPRRSTLELLESRQLFSAAAPTVSDQYMLELVNRARANPQAEVVRDGLSSLNEGLAAGTISPAAKQPLAFNAYLIDSATKHSQWMLATQTFSHYEGSVDPGAREIAAGYKVALPYGYGENIGYFGTRPTVPSPNPTVAAIEKDLFVDTTEAGRGHRLNLMLPDYKEIGIGNVTGVFDGYNAVMDTQDFAYTSGNSFLTGVAYNDSNRNGFYDPGEGLGGVTVVAVRTSDHAKFSTTTWAAGGYSLQLPPGTYAVTGSGGGLGGTVSYGGVVIGSLNVERDFTPQSLPPVSRYSTISGTVFHAVAGSPGLGGWTIVLDLVNSAGKVTWEYRGLTAANGSFKLSHLTPGHYRLSEVVKSGYHETTPSGGVYNLSLTGQTLTGLNFGNR